MRAVKKGFMIGAVAARTGIAVSAIRHYEAEGLVFSERNSGGQRVFRASDIRRISFVIIAQRLGFSLKDIKTQLDRLPDNRTPTKKDWERMARFFKTDIEERIAQLENLRDRLTGCIGCGCLSLKTCAIYNPNDQAGEGATGPRYLLGDTPQI